MKKRPLRNSMSAGAASSASADSSLPRAISVRPAATTAEPPMKAEREPTLPTPFARSVSPCTMVMPFAGICSTSVMSCRCQIWRVHSWLLRRRSLWTITIGVRSAVQDPTAAQPAQQIHVAAAWDHDRAWEKVQAWIDEGKELPKTLDQALVSID